MSSATLLLPVAGLIAATVAASLWLDGIAALPYFPIEVSRMLASGVGATRVFQAYVVAVTLYYGYYNWWHLAMGVCVLGVSLFDDVSHYAVHMGCVGAMVALVVARTWREPARLSVVVSALALYVVRIGIKVVAVLVQDRAQPWAGVVALEMRVQQLMFDARGATPETLVLLRLGGVLQIIVFLLFATVV